MSDNELSYEVRAVMPGEEEKFLSHMCTCFSLDVQSARPIFYGDPFFNLDYKWVLLDRASNEIVSSLTIIPAAVRCIGGALMPVAGLAGVCTLPDLRGNGNAQLLIRNVLQNAPRQYGFAAAALVTDRPEIYRKLGFEHCSTVVHWTAHRKLLPDFREAEFAANVSLREDLDVLKEIKALYEHAIGTQPGFFLRDDRRWRVIDSGLQSDEAVLWRNVDRLEGCLIYRCRQHRGDRILEVVDLIALTAAARRGLIGFLHRLENIDLVSGQSRPSDLRKLGIQDTPRFTSYRRDGVMLSILDLDTCISLVAQTGILTPVIRRSEFGLTIRLQNSLSPGDRKPLRLFSVSTDRLGVAIGIAPADEMTGDWIAVDMGAMAQLFFGYRSASKLHAQDRLWISSDNALAIADSLFPAFETILGQLDTF